MSLSNIFKLSAVMLLGGFFEAKGADINCQVYSRDRVQLSYSSDCFAIRDINSEETKVSKYNIKDLSALSDEKVLELISSGQIYFRVSKDSNQAYQLSMSARLLGGRPPANTGRSEAEKSAPGRPGRSAPEKSAPEKSPQDKSAPEKSAPDNESVVDKCVRDVCKAGWGTAGSTIGAEVGAIAGGIGAGPGAAVGGLVGVAIGAVACDKDTGGGGGGGDGCVVM